MSALVYLGLLGSMATLTRLVRSDLRRHYLGFSIWTGSNILKFAAIAFGTSAFGINSKSYITTWQLCTAITALLLIAPGIEVYWCVANDYPRLRDFGRKVLIYSSLAAFVLALVPIGVDDIMDRLRTTTLLVGVLARSSAFAVWLGLWFAVSHMRSVPIPERRNLRCHRRLLMVYSIGNAVGMSMLVFTGNRKWALVYMGTAAVCWCLWPFLLTREGQTLPMEEFSGEGRREIKAAVGEFRGGVRTLAEQVSASEQDARIEVSE